MSQGRLTFADGSIYDGMWRNGKRFGVGTFYYSNGDVFHGTWRDDLMHGKVVRFFVCIPSNFFKLNTQAISFEEDLQL